MMGMGEEETLARVGGFLPPTYDPIFHETDKEDSWIHRMPYRTLGQTEMSMSLLSYGASALANFYCDNASRTESMEAIQLALKSGVNYIETGPWYGPSEEIIGEALKDVPRNSYYISTKAGRYFTPGWEGRFDFSRGKVLKSIESSLVKLGVDCVDIIQVHDVEFCLDPDILVKETFPALESIVKAGKAKYIGITGYDLEAIKRVIESSPVKIDSILNYSRYNFNDMSLDKYVPYFQSKKIGVINASPVSMGLFTTRGPPAWHAAPDKVKTLASQAAQLANSKGISIEEVALGFGLRPRNRQIASTLVSMPTKDILFQNLDIVCKPYTKEDAALYEEMLEIFREGLGEDQPGHWEGIELAQYKEAMIQQKSE